MKKPGRPKKEPTKVISVPTDRLREVEKALGRSLAENQIPIVKIRVALSEVDKVKKVLS